MPTSSPRLPAPTHVESSAARSIIVAPSRVILKDPGVRSPRIESATCCHDPATTGALAGILDARPCGTVGGLELLEHAVRGIADDEQAQPGREGLGHDSEHVEGGPYRHPAVARGQKQALELGVCVWVTEASREVPFSINAYEQSWGAFAASSNRAELGSDTAIASSAPASPRRIDADARPLRPERSVVEVVARREASVRVNCRRSPRVRGPPNDCVNQHEDAAQRISPTPNALAALRTVAPGTNRA